MAFYNHNHQWIDTQRSGEAHPLCYYVFLAIKVILCAHTKDYPNNPPESGEFCSPVSHNLAWAKFVCIGALPHLLFIIQCAIDEFISFCNCRAHQTTLDNVVWLSTLCCTWELQFSPPQITCAHHLQSIYMQQSNTSLQHMSGMLMPSDTVSSRSSSMIHPKRISPFFHDLCNKTAAMWVFYFNYF